MIKKIILFVCILVCAVPVHAAKKNRHAVGPMLGYQTSQLSYFRENIQSDLSQGLTVGVFGRFYRGKVYIQPELLYFRNSNLFDVTLYGNGSNNEIHLSPEGTRLEVTLNSVNLQLPVLVGCDLINLHLIRLRAHAGPTVNYVMASKVFLEYTVENHLQTKPLSEEFDPRNIAWGFQAGLGLDLLNKVSLDINYNFGLTGMYKHLCETKLGELFDFSNLEESRLNMFMVTVGVRLF